MLNASILMGILATAVMPADVGTLLVDPPSLKLEGSSSRRLLLVELVNASGDTVDLTRQARYRSMNPAVATVDDRGLTRGVSDGETSIVIEANNASRTIPVRVEGSKENHAFNFENDVIPILSKLGCNASGCHGKAEGQNGFKLSVFGFDPSADYDALTRESRGRRIFPAAPERSLLLAKMTGDVPHGGGVKATHDSDDYRLVRDWIAAGMPFGLPSDPKVESIRVEPHERRLAMKSSQQLRVTARYTDGREVDVTTHAKFQSNNDSVGRVDADGLVVMGEVPGDVAIMAAYMGAVDVFRAIAPRPVAEAESVADRLPEPSNPIDSAVADKLRKLNIKPSGICSDAEYLRRVSLDVIGTLPTADEARRFLADKRPDRRARLVDELLQRPEYADYWALKWSDLLRVDREKLGHKRAFAFYRWIRESLAENIGLDAFARAVITAEGPLDEVGPANYFKVVAKPGEAASSLAQVFLGVRIACAECHHHPYDRWAQADYYGMSAYFSTVGVKPGPRGEEVVAEGEAVSREPRSGRSIKPKPLGSAIVPVSDGLDVRAGLADWLTAPENPLFARNIANRYWAHFNGRGLVEPVDDVRDTNPPSNPALLDALASTLVNARLDAKTLIRAITGSDAYQRSTTPNTTNLDDEQNHSRAKLRRVDAEVLLDMICQTTGVPEKFDGVPAGSRAVQLWDSKVPHYFLRIFGRPERITACECERASEPAVSQVLHLLNAPGLNDKLSHDAGTIARMVRKYRNDDALAEELYLTFYARFPTAAEKVAATKHLGLDPTRRREAAEDLAWSLMNSLEFMFNH